MKKVLSVILAIMMLFGAMGISASAADAGVNDVAIGNRVEGEIIPTNAVISVFFFGEGTNLDFLDVYTLPDGFFVKKGAGEVKGTYVMVPHSKCHEGSNLKGDGTGYIYLPSVSAPEGQTFQGWKNVGATGDGKTYGAGRWDIPANMEGATLYFEATYRTTETEDTMATVLGILMKVFGTIIGILFLDGSAQAGVELMEKMLGGLF